MLWRCPKCGDTSTLSGWCEKDRAETVAVPYLPASALQAEIEWLRERQAEQAQDFKDRAGDDFAEGAEGAFDVAAERLAALLDSVKP